MPRTLLAHKAEYAVDLGDGSHSVLGRKGPEMERTVHRGSNLLSGRIWYNCAMPPASLLRPQYRVTPQTSISPYLKRLQISKRWWHSPAAL
jgi:hypothetical protein